ncbi:hypothetical protein BC829DRAFT_424015 [Chytridium lagenaria]|nr:hypothetical protein BC829DRAFT_424015 [Chytridium lagenaria]
MRTFDNATFENWAQTYRARQRRKLKVRVVGSGHSPGDIVCTDGMLISIDELKEVVEVDRENKRVTVQGGIKIKDLNDVLASHGLALPNLGSISDQTMAGLISTGTHGTGLEHGILATMVESIRMVKSTLEIVTLSKTMNEELLRYALCSLGSFGVITQVTINVVEAFNLSFTQSSIPFDFMIKNWGTLVKSAEFTRFWWFPHTDDCVFWKADKTEQPPAPAPSSFVKDRVLGVWAYELSLYLTSLLPSLVPTINKRHFDRFFKKTVTGIDQSYVTEWAIDWNDGPEALIRLRQFIEKSELKRMLQLRSVLPYGAEIPRDLFWQGYELIMRTLKGRPHWAKAYSLTNTDLAAVYPRFNDFRRLREQMDPDGLFINDYIQRHVVGNVQKKQIVVLHND